MKDSNENTFNNENEDENYISFDHIFKKFQKKKNPFNFKNNFENFEF